MAGWRECEKVYDKIDDTGATHEFMVNTCDTVFQVPQIPLRNFNALRLFYKIYLLHPLLAPQPTATRRTSLYLLWKCAADVTNRFLRRWWKVKRISKCEPTRETRRYVLWAQRGHKIILRLLKFVIHRLIYYAMDDKVKLIFDITIRDSRKCSCNILLSYIRCVYPGLCCAHNKYH